MRAWSGLLVAVASMACAEGTELASSFTQEIEPAGIAGAGGEGGGAGPAHPSTGSMSQSSSGQGGAAGKGSSGSAGEGAGGDGAGGQESCDFTAPNTCPSAEWLGTIAGDDGGLLTAKGSTSKW